MQEAAEELGARVYDQAPLPLDEIFVAYSGASCAALRQEDWVIPSPILAMAWETWGSHRRAWWMILGTVPVFALFLHLSAGALEESEGLRFLSFFPLLLSLLFVAATSTSPNGIVERASRGFPNGSSRSLSARAYWSRVRWSAAC